MKRKKPRFTLVRRDGTMFSVKSKRGAPFDLSSLPRRIYFPRASSTPVPRSLLALRTCADWLRERPSRRVFLVGHANRRNWSEASRALATARAHAVRDLLVFLGAARRQIGSILSSKLHSMGRDSTAKLRGQHRYVEIIPGASGGAISQSIPRPRRMAVR